MDHNHSNEESTAAPRQTAVGDNGVSPNMDYDTPSEQSLMASSSADGTSSLPLSAANMASPIAVAAALPKDESLYESLLRYHNENDDDSDSADDDSSRDKRRRRRKVAGKAIKTAYENDVDGEDDRKLPPSLYNRSQDCKPPARPINGLKSAPSNFNTATAHIISKPPLVAAAATGIQQNFMASSSSSSEHGRRHAPDAANDSSTLSPASPHRRGPKNVVAGSFYQAALEESRLREGTAAIKKTSSPRPITKPGAVMVNEPAIRPNSAMYRAAYGDDSSTHRQLSSSSFREPMGVHEVRHAVTALKQSRGDSRRHLELREEGDNSADDDLLDDEGRSFEAAPPLIVPPSVRPAATPHAVAPQGLSRSSHGPRRPHGRNRLGGAGLLLGGSSHSPPRTRSGAGLGGKTNSSSSTRHIAAVLPPSMNRSTTTGGMAMMELSHREGGPTTTVTTAAGGGGASFAVELGSYEHIRQVYQRKKNKIPAQSRGVSPVRNTSQYVGRDSQSYSTQKPTINPLREGRIPVGGGGRSPQSDSTISFDSPMRLEQLRPSPRSQPNAQSSSRAVTSPCAIPREVPSTNEFSLMPPTSYPHYGNSTHLSHNDNHYRAGGEAPSPAVPSRDYLSIGKKITAAPMRKSSNPEIVQRQVPALSPRRSNSADDINDMDEDLKLALEISKQDTGGQPPTLQSRPSLGPEDVFAKIPKFPSPPKYESRQTSFGRAALSRAEESQNNSLADVLLALKLSGEETGVSDRRKSTSLDELLTLEMANIDNASGGTDQSVTDLVAAGISTDAGMVAASVSTDAGSANEQFRILQQIREEQEQKELELALRASQAESGDVGAHNMPAQDFLLSQQKAMAEFGSSGTRSRKVALPQRQNYVSVSTFDSDGRRRELLKRGTQETQQAITSGQAHIVACRGCKGRLQAPVSYSLVFCPKCQTISPA